MSCFSRFAMYAVRPRGDSVSNLGCLEKRMLSLDIRVVEIGLRECRYAVGLYSLSLLGLPTVELVVVLLRTGRGLPDARIGA